MSGHSKWANIKHRKGRQDARRGKLFAKLVKAIEASARTGGGDPAANVTLAQAIQKAKDNSVPADNIERAVKRGIGEVEGVDYIDLWYEGYAPGGVAVYVHCLTDNRNRASSEVRAAFTRNNGNLGEPGSVAYLFEQKGYVLVTGDEETVMLAALEGGAEDVRSANGQWEIITAASDLAGVRAALEASEIPIEEAEVTQLPSTTIPVDAANAPKVLRLVDALEDLEDVQEVFANFDIPDEVLAAMGEE